MRLGDFHMLTPDWAPAEEVVMMPGLSLRPPWLVALHTYHSCKIHDDGSIGAESILQ